MATKIVYNCDWCGCTCEKEDGRVTIEMAPGDGRDVEPSFIHAEFQLVIPYAISNGIICRQCKLTALKRYVSEAA